MFAWLSRRPLLLWPIAWGFAALGLIIADVASDPRHGPLWAAYAFGTVAWAWAGSLTFEGKLTWRSMLVWGFSYAFACGCAVLWVRLLPESRDLWVLVNPLIAWALGTTVGPLLHGLVMPRRWPPLDLAHFMVGWGICSFAGAWAAIFGA